MHTLHRVGSIFIILFVFFYIKNSAAQDLPTNTDYHPPLKGQLKLSGTFQELRSNHFHSGIDIKTNHQIGKKVYAIERGYVYRVNISSGGYGKALYIKHPNGITSVYAHLNRFTDSLSNYITSLQYKLKAHEVNLYLSPGKFQYKKGEVIAYSGNSGYSGGPHLHFEIRRTKDEHPLNPFKFGIEAKDTRPPKMYKLISYNYKSRPINEFTRSSQTHWLNKGGNNYTLRRDEPLIIGKHAGFGIKTYDYLNLSNNPCGVYKARLELDSAKIFEFTADEFAFKRTRYINSFIDRRRNIRDDETIMKLFKEPNNALQSYDVLVNQGIIELHDNKTHTVTITLTDYAGNTTNLNFSVKKGKSVSNYSNDSHKMPLYYNTVNYFQNKDVKVQIKENSLYTNSFLNINTYEDRNRSLSRIFSIGENFQVLQEPAKIFLKPQKIKEKYYSKALIGRKEGNTIDWLSGDYTGHFIKTTADQLGDFVIGVDTVPPRIRRINTNPVRNRQGEKILKLSLDDEKSGIQSYNGYIDDEWALFEYNARDELLIFKIDNTRFPSGETHHIKVTAQDQHGNTSQVTYTSRW